MDTRSEIREFLTSRRARITPEQAGLRTYGTGTRRVPGLRREEVALLAGVSVDYYTRLERGNASGVSETVLEALARALQLDDTERAHLFDLARATQTSPRRDAGAAAADPADRAAHARRDDGRAGVRPQRPARHPRREPARPRPLLRAFRQRGAAAEHRSLRLPRPACHEFYVDWDRVANDVVAVLRAEAGRDPYDRDLSDLVGELSTRSELFRTLWAAHNVRTHDTGRQARPSSARRRADLTFEAMELVADPGLTMFVYTAEPGSKSEQALNLLASWTRDTRRGEDPCRSRGTASTPQPGLSDWFTGAVYIDPVAAPSGASRLSASSVHFTPGARTAWHTHPNGQTIWVLEGVGLCQRRGGPVEVIRPGDRVFFEPGEEHWHGAAPNRFMTHLAMVQVDEEGIRALWGARQRRGVRGGARVGD